MTLLLLRSGCLNDSVCVLFRLFSMRQPVLGPRASAHQQSGGDKQTLVVVLQDRVGEAVALDARPLNATGQLQKCARFAFWPGQASECHPPTACP